jgi:hypothetical protein
MSGLVADDCSISLGTKKEIFHFHGYIIIYFESGYGSWMEENSEWMSPWFTEVKCFWQQHLFHRHSVSLDNYETSSQVSSTAE